MELLRRASAGAKASPRYCAWNSVGDALAFAAILFVLWKVFLAPRSLEAAGVYPAPHAVFARLAGNPFRVADARGRVVFLDFYASWCEPCKLEAPLVHAWQRTHPGALVVPVDVGETRSAAAEFARRHSLGNVALDPQVTARPLFGVDGFPAIIVIDPSGYIRAKWQGLNPAVGLAMSNAQGRLQLVAR